MNKVSSQIEGSILGRYLLQVVRRDGSVELPLGPEFRKNLIVNGGLDQIFTYSLGAPTWPTTTGPWGYVTNYCLAGTGSSAAQVSDTGLQSQVKYSNSYLQATGANSTAYYASNGTAIHQRTYEFTTETAPATYNEIGWGSGANSGLWSRVVLPSPVSLQAGDNLRITYQLTISLPQIVTPSEVSTSTTGWDASGTLGIVGGFQDIFGSIASNGTYSGGGLSSLLGHFGSWTYMGNPDINDVAVLATNSTFSAANTNPNIAEVYSGNSTSSPSTASSYSEGSFSLTKTYTFIPSTPPVNISNGVYSVFFKWSSGPSAVQLLLSSAQSKSNEYRLGLQLTSTWARA